VLNKRLELERKSLILLLILIPSYVIFFWFMGAVIMIIAFSANKGYLQPIEDRNASSVWISTFLSISAFANAGFSPIDNNLIALSYNPVLLLTISILIFCGNTCYPLVFRLVLLMLSKIPRLKETIEWLLAHSRLCYFYLFSTKVTLYLLGVITFLNLTQFSLTLGEEWNTVVLAPYNSTALRLVNVVLTTSSTRNAGFNSLNVFLFTPSVQFYLYILMYITVYPLSVSIRSSLAQEEENDFDRVLVHEHPLTQSTIIKLQDLAEKDPDTIGVDSPAPVKPPKKKPGSFSITKNLIFRDVVGVFLGTIIICMVEKDKFFPSNANAPDNSFTLFPVMFEVVSGFGNVGLSIGCNNCGVLSLSFAFSTFSKFVMIVIMVAGVHRSLPQDLDSAIVLPRRLLTVNEQRVSLTIERRSMIDEKRPQQSSSSSTKRKNAKPADSQAVPMVDKDKTSSSVSAETRKHGDNTEVKVSSI